MISCEWLVNEKMNYFLGIFWQGFCACRGKKIMLGIWILLFEIYVY